MQSIFLSLLLATVIPVPPGANLQAALDAAQPGDEIVLQAGATYTGPFTLGPKAGSGEIIVRSSAVDAMPVGTRVTPASAALMPKLISNSDAVIRVEPRAQGWRLIGLEIAPAPGRFLTDAVRIGSGLETTVAEQPRNIAIERSYIHGDPVAGSRRGVAMNGVENSVIDSTIIDFKAVGVDAQAIAGWTGAGPHTIRNNHLEASGENILFGGADPPIHGLIPTGIRIEGNEIRKPDAWRGSQWTIKNLLQLKNARQVVIENNLLENSWPAGQAGYAVVLTPRNQDGQSPWSAIEDVRFANNTVRRAAHGILILGRDDQQSSGPLQRLTIANNSFEVTGALFELIDNPRDVVIENNQGTQAAMAVSASGAPTGGFVFRNNVVVRDEGGILGVPQFLASYLPGAVVQGNTFVGGTAANYPANNAFTPLPVAEIENTSLRSGYAVITPDDGSGPALVSALVGLVRNAVAVSQTTVFPALPAASSVMFVDVASGIGRNTGIAVANPQSYPVSVTLQLLDDSGRPAIAARTIVLEPRAQFARFVTELLPDMPLMFSGTLTSTATAPVASMGFRFNGENFSAAANDSATPTGSILPHYAMGGQWATAFSVVNRSASAISGRIDLFDTVGNPAAVTLNGVTANTFRYFLPPGGSVLLAPRDGNGMSAF
jgi:hypothetical protein